IHGVLFLLFWLGALWWPHPTPHPHRLGLNFFAPFLPVVFVLFILLKKSTPRQDNEHMVLRVSL
ncbi:hypothetical protein ACVGXB_00345, partial [Enterobacter intestinihominis]